MAKLDDFDKIIHNGNEISKVLHQNQEIWRASGLIAGDMEAGFYGEVPVSEFITGDALCSLAGITAGASQFFKRALAKVFILRETVFVAKKPIRYRITWDHINAAGCVFGSKIVAIKGQSYKVTLLKGKAEGKQNDISGSKGSILHNSMWNRLMGQIHENAPSNWTVPNNMENTLVNWGINYTNADLHTHTANGANCWCQEYGGSSKTRLVRGGANSVSYSHAPNRDALYNNYGFRPALILVP